MREASDHAAQVHASELDYDLPEGLIAQAPLAERDHSRLLLLDRHGPGLAHRSVRDLPGLMRPALLILNDTRVVPARLFATKPTGGRVEILLLERLSPAGARERWSAMARGSKSLRPDMRLRIAESFEAAVVGVADGTVTLDLSSPLGVSAALASHGEIPLPPYIARAAEASDTERYQTVFARHEGSVAAPTAGLHLSPDLLAALEDAGHQKAYVTLHVGAGTFQPLRVDTLSDHVMHEERWQVPAATAQAIAAARDEGRPVLAIGTTVVRTLESAVDEAGVVHAGEGRTSIFITPGHTFRAVDALLTNFHLPRSTLLALVMAFHGIEATRAAYRAAVEARYRFFSYGDAMLVRSASLARPKRSDTEVL